VQHCIAGTALCVAGLAVYVKVPGLLLVIVCALRSRPRRCPRFMTARDGSWELPDELLNDLQILPATRFTQWWVDLQLGRSDGVQRSLRLWRDSLEPGDWRQLLILLREHRRRKV
jgi:hypothetical protein